MAHKLLLPKVFALVAFLTLAFNANAASSTKGDVNSDGEINIADVNAVINVILGSGSNALADANDDGEINIADVNSIINTILGDSVAPQDNHEFVDLGLPSGTLWATCNIGAVNPEEYGSYFAWGETIPKNYYDWETYKWGYYEEDFYLMLTKYNTDNDYGSVDGLTELDSEDDAAYVNWGSSWRIPGKEQIKELCNSCSWQWSELNGVFGQLVTGPNGNTLFLPAAGYFVEDYRTLASMGGYYWSRTLVSSYPDYAYYLDFGWNNWECMDFGFRRPFGYTVRAVRVSQN